MGALDKLNKLAASETPKKQEVSTKSVKSSRPKESKKTASEIPAAKKTVENTASKEKEKTAITPQLPKMAEDTQKENISQPARKVGRPRVAEYTKLSINMKSENMDVIKLAAGIKFKGNISAYLNDLVEKDITENEKLYAQLKALAGI